MKKWFENMKTPARTSLVALTGFLVLNFFLSMNRENNSHIPSILLTASPAYGANAERDDSPYGGSKSGAYGEKRAVRTKEEAAKVLKEYFAKKNAKIGRIIEKELYFEAEILDKDNKVIDTVIVNKRTGRIRSIF